MKGNSLLMSAVVGIAVFFIAKNAFANNTNTGGNTNTNKKQELINWINGSNETAATKEKYISVFNTMTQTEIDAIHYYVFNFVVKGLQLPNTDSLYNSLVLIATKYNIFQ